MKIYRRDIVNWAMCLVMAALFLCLCDEDETRPIGVMLAMKIMAGVAMVGVAALRVYLMKRIRN